MEDVFKCPWPDCGVEISYGYLQQVFQEVCIDGHGGDSSFEGYCPSCDETISVEVWIDINFYNLTMERRMYHDSWHDRRRIQPDVLRRRERRERDHGRRSYDKARWITRQAIKADLK